MDARHLRPALPELQPIEYPGFLGSADFFLDQLRPAGLLKVRVNATKVLLTLGAFLIAWLGLAAAARADVGPTGGFETSVAIKVPPFHGLEPRLGLAYSSSAPNGWLGVGWNLEGLSRIRRQAPGRGLPRWDASDTFTLNGQDLLACPAPNPEDQSALARSPSCAHRLGGLSAYTTRVESFQRIAVEGDPLGTSAGDARWLVWRTDGVVATYEPGLLTTRGVLEWQLTQVKDLSGNTVSYEWAPPQAEQVSVLQAIRYGDVEIRFVSERRPDPIRVATGAGLVTLGTRLQVIDELAGGSRIRAYALRYGPQNLDEPFDQSFLASVQQYGSDANVTSEGVHGPTKLPPSTFHTSPQANTATWASRSDAPLADWATDWPAGPDDATRFATTAEYFLEQWPKGGKWTTADLNGDKRIDLILTTPLSNRDNYPSYDLRIAYTQPNGGYRSHYQHLPWSSSRGRPPGSLTPLVDDVNGDGFTDLTLWAGYDTATMFGDSNPQFIPLTETGKVLETPLSVDYGEIHGELLMGDVTGDGLADLVAIDKPSEYCPLNVSGSASVQVGIGTGSGHFDTDKTHRVCLPGLPVPSGEAAADFQLADVNGDLKSDVVVFQPAASTYSPPGRPDGPPTAQIITAVSDGLGGFHTHLTETDQSWGKTSELLDSRNPGFYRWCERLYPREFPNCDAVESFGVDTEVEAFPIDANGDGRSDLVVLRPGPNGRVAAWTALSRGNGTYEKLTEGVTPFATTDLQTYPEFPPSRWLAADFDGDGAGDLGVVTPSKYTDITDVEHASPSIHRALSDRRGSWTASLETTTRDWSGDCHHYPKYLHHVDIAGCLWEMLAATGDINGDGRDDVLFAHPLESKHQEDWVALDADPTPAAPVAAHLLSGDVNADGRQDLLYPTATAIGVQVRVWQQRADHTYQRIDPINVALGKDHLAQRSWLVADLNCDQRTDLVNLDRGVTVLLAHGEHDWQAPTVTEPAELPAVGRWSVADVTGDHCDDLLRIGPRELHALGGGTYHSQPGVLVMAGRPDIASLQEEWSTPSPPDALAYPLTWRTADIDTDGKADLVGVNSQTGHIDTLLRRDGGWHHVGAQVTTSPTVPSSTPPPQSDCLVPSSDAIVSTGAEDTVWRALDVNADGAVDLVRARVDRTGALLVETLLSHGDGRYTPRATLAGERQEDGWKPAALPWPADADDQFWTPADLDGDGRGDLVRVVNRGDKVVMLAIGSNGGGCWTLAKGPGAAAATLPPSGAWRVGDWDGSGQASALRLDATTEGLTVSGFDSTVADDRIVRTANGLGASTSIDYKPATSMLDAGATTSPHCRLPTGVAAIPVVVKLATSDAPTSTTDTSTMRYGCPSFSAQLRGLVAWRETWSTHQAAVNRPASIQHVVRDVFASGIVQPTLDEVTDADGGRLRATESAYEPVSDNPQDAPQVDLLAETAVSECDGRSCATSTVTLAHDEFGNITSELRRAAGSGRQRRTETFYLHHHGRWLQALPRLTRTVDPAHPQRLLRATLTCYDNDPSVDCGQLPSDARGFATLTRAWDDTPPTPRFVITGRASYDEFGNQQTTTDARGNTTTTDFDPQLHLYPTRVCNPRRHCTRQPAWDRRADAPLQVIDANGAVTNHTYDPLGRPDGTERPGGAVEKVTYTTDAAAGTVTETTTSAPGEFQWTRTLTDGLGRTYLAQRPGAEYPGVVETRTDYSDASTRPYRTAVPYFVLNVPVWETIQYDAIGRPVRQLRADGAAATRQYLIRDGLSAVQERDEAGRTRTRLSDGWGGLARVEQPSVVPGRVAITRYTYNAVDDLTAVTDPGGNTIRNEFDTLGRKTAEHDPDRGTTRYRYDPAGNLRRQTDARGRVLVYDYDQLNRLTSRHDLAAKTTSRWHYDQPNHGASLGRLTSVQDPSAAGCRGSISRDLSYDPRGNLARETRCIRGAPRTFGRHHDALDRLETLTYPDGEQLTYRYDQAGHLFSVSGYVRAMHYDAADQLVLAEYANGTQGRWDHNPSRGWLDAQTLQDRAGRRLFDNDYPERDPSGLIKAARSHSNHTAERYRYDALGRLRRVTGTWQQQLGYDDLGNLTSNSQLGTYRYAPRRQCTGRGAGQRCAGPHAVTGAGSSSYQYDATGNMVAAKTEPGPARRKPYAVKAKQPGKHPDTLSAIAADHLGDPRRWPEIFALNKGRPYPRPPGGRFTNPDRIFPGQRLVMPALTSSPTTPRQTSRKLTWDSNGQLTQIDDLRAGRITNLYDADGARVQQTDRTGIIRFYSQLADWTSRTGLTKYIYAGSLLVAERHGTQRRWYTLDRLSSPRLITNHTGHVIGRQNYSSYGQAISRTGRAAPIGYGGHRPMGQTGLIYMLARHYDPTLARMLSADTIIPDPTNPQALNRYSYAYNNPVANTDPTGHRALLAEASTEEPKNPEFASDFYSFMATSDLYAETGSRAFSQPSDYLIKSSERMERKWLKDIGIATPPSSSSVTQGSAPDPQSGQASDAVLPAAEAPQPNDQTPQTGSSTAAEAAWRMPSDDPSDPGATVEQLIEKYGVVDVVGQPPGPDLGKVDVPPQVEHWNPEVFIWFSWELKAEKDISIGKGRALKFEGAAEGVHVFGVNPAGPYRGMIAAGGGSIGIRGGEWAGYGALYGGQESITQYSRSSTGWNSREELEDIILVEGGIGPLLSGAYQSGAHPTASETGLYFGARAGPFAAGFGFNLDLLELYTRQLLVTGPQVLVPRL